MATGVAAVVGSTFTGPDPCWMEDLRARLTAESPLRLEVRGDGCLTEFFFLIASGSTLPGVLVAVADALGVAIPPFVKLLAAGSRGCLTRVGGGEVSREMGGDETLDTGSGSIEMTVSMEV